MAARGLCALLAGLGLVCAPAASAAGGGSAPLTLYLVIDESMSMRGSKASYTTAAVQTVVALVPEATRVAIVGFGQGAKDETRGYVTVAGNADRVRLRSLVAKITFNGERTNYLAPLELVGRQARAGEGTTLVIFLSDGEDNCNRGSRGWGRVLGAAKAIHASGARLETVFLESKGGLAGLFTSPKRNRQRMVELAGGGGRFHPIVGKPPQIVDVLVEILGDLANYAEVDLDARLGRRPDATVSQLVLLGFPPRRARARQLARDEAPADRDACGGDPYPAPRDPAQGTTDTSSLIKVFSIPRPGGRRWSLRPAERPAEWQARALERTAVLFEFAANAPKPTYDLPREAVRAVIEVTGPSAASPQALLKALPGLEGHLALTSQTGDRQEDWKALPASRWLSLVPTVRGDRLLLVPATPARDGRLPDPETRRLIDLTRQAKGANYTCVARIRFGPQGQRGEVVKQKSFKVQVTIAVTASPDPLDLGQVVPGAAAQAKALNVSCNWTKPAQVEARLDGLVCRDGGEPAAIPSARVALEPAAFRLPGTQRLQVRLACPADARAGAYQGRVHFREAGTGHGLGSCEIRAAVSAVLKAPRRLVLTGSAGGDATLDPKARPLVTTNAAAPMALTLAVDGKLPGKLEARLLPASASSGKPSQIALALRAVPPATKPGVYEAAATVTATARRPGGGTYAVRSAPIALRAELAACDLAASPAQLRLEPAVAGDRTQPASLALTTRATAALKLRWKASDLAGPGGAKIPASRLALAWAAQPVARRGAPAKASVSLDLRHPRQGAAVAPFPPGNYAGTLSLATEGAEAEVRVAATVLPIALDAQPPALAFPPALAGGTTQAAKLTVRTNTPDPLPLGLAASDLAAKGGATLAAKRLRLAPAAPRQVSRGKPAEIEVAVDLAPSVTRVPDKEPVVRPVAEGTYRGTLSLSAPGCASRGVAVSVPVQPISIRAEPEALAVEPAHAGGDTHAARLTVHTNSPADLPIAHAATALAAPGGARIPADRIQVEWDGKPSVRDGAPAAARVFVDLRDATVRRQERAPAVRRFPPGDYAGKLTLSAPGCADAAVALRLTVETTWLRADPPRLAFEPTSAGKTTPPLRLSVRTNSPAAIALKLTPTDLAAGGHVIPANRVRVTWDGEPLTRKVKPAVATLAVDLAHQSVTTPERGRTVRQFPAGDYKGHVTLAAEGFEPQTLPVVVRVVSISLAAEPRALAVRAKAGRAAVESPPVVLATNARDPLEVTLGTPREPWHAPGGGARKQPLERLPFALAMVPKTVALSASTAKAQRTVRLVVADLSPGARGTYGCKVDVEAHGVSATLALTVAVEPVRLWLDPGELDLGKLVAGGTSGVGKLRLLTDSEQPVSVAMGVVGLVKEGAGRPTLAVLDKPLAVSAKAPGTVSLRARAPGGATPGQHRFALTCRATEWEGTTASAAVVARVALPAYHIEPRLVDFGTGLTGSTLGPQRVTVSSDGAAAEGVSVACSRFTLEQGGKRVTLAGARVTATPRARPPSSR